jgi:hypothetical protein
VPQDSVQMSFMHSATACGSTHLKGSISPIRSFERLQDIGQIDSTSLDPLMEHVSKHYGHRMELRCMKLKCCVRYNISIHEQPVMPVGRRIVRQPMNRDLS